MSSIHIRNSAASCCDCGWPTGATKPLFSADVACRNAVGSKTLESSVSGSAVSKSSSSDKVDRNRDSDTVPSSSLAASTARHGTRYGVRAKHCNTEFIKHWFWPLFLRPGGFFTRPPNPRAFMNLFLMADAPLLARPSEGVRLRLSIWRRGFRFRSPPNHFDGTFSSLLLLKAVFWGWETGDPKKEPRLWPTEVAALELTGACWGR